MKRFSSHLLCWVKEHALSLTLFQWHKSVKNENENYKTLHLFILMQNKSSFLPFSQFQQIKPHIINIMTNTMKIVRMIDAAA